MYLTLQELLQKLSYWEFCTESNWQSFSLKRLDANEDIDQSEIFLQENLLSLGFYDSL